MSERFTNSQVMRLAIDSRLSEIRTALPGKVNSYDRTNQTAEIEPQIEDSSNPLPILQNVPVIFPRGGDGYLLLDVSAGDFGLILFCDREIGTWRNEGRAITPGDIAQLDASSPVFLPGLVPSGNSLTQSAGRTILGGDDIRITADDADQRVYKGDDLKDHFQNFLDDLKTWCNAVSSEITAMGGDITGPTATFTGLGGDVDIFKAQLALDLSSKVRIK